MENSGKSATNNPVKKPWIQAAVDVTDISVGKEIAQTAVNCGAEWIEVGTPLLFHYGFDAIRQIKEVVKNRAKLVADYKYFYGPTMIGPAAHSGADFILMEDIYQDRFVSEALELAQENHVDIIYSLLSKKPSDYVQRGLELAELGVKYLFMWRTVSYKGQVYETLRQMRSATDIFVGVSDDDLESAVCSVREGADWITFGTALSKRDPVLCQKWIDTIHSQL